MGVSLNRTVETDRICTESWNRALFAFATATIFEARARRYRVKLRVLSFLGIGVPLLVGGIVLAFGVEYRYIKFVLFVASIVVIIQLIWSLYSLIAGWDDEFGYARVSAVENFDISTKFAELGRQASSPADDLAIHFAVLQARDDGRRANDSTRNLKDKEKRYGHRAGLRHFQRECQCCHKVPESMKASKCDVCGGF